MTLGLQLGLSKGAAGIVPTYANSSPSIGVEPITGFNATEGTIYYEFNDTTMNNGNDSIIMMVSDGTNNNRIFIQKRTTQDRFRVLTQSAAGTNEVYDGYLVAFANGNQRLAITYSADTFKLWWNGMLICKQDGNYTGVSFSQVDIGQLLGGTFTHNGTPLDFKYYDTALSDNQCAGLTRGVQIQSGITYDETKDLYIFMGQSNSVGQATGTPTYTNTGNIFLLDNSMTVVSYTDPFADPTGSKITALDDSGGNYDVGSAGFFADDLAGLTGNDIMVCPANLSGTSFFGTTPTWHTNSSAYRTSGTKITGMMATAIAAINQIQLAKQFAPIKGYIWQQGRGDVANATSEADYDTAETDLIQMVQRAATNAAWFNCSMPARHSSETPTQADWDAINNAQVDVANALSGVFMVEGTDIDGATGDRVHYDLAGYETVGGLIATEVNARLY